MSASHEQEDKNEQEGAIAWLHSQKILQGGEETRNTPNLNGSLGVDGGLGVGLGWHKKKRLSEKNGRE